MGTLRLILFILGAGIITAICVYWVVTGWTKLIDKKLKELKERNKL